LKLKTKILLINSFVFIILFTIVSAGSYILKNRLIESFKGDTEKLFSILTSLLEQKNKIIVTNIEDIMLDQTLKLGFTIINDDILTNISHKKIITNRFIMIAYYNSDGSIFKTFAANNIFEESQIKLLNYLNIIPPEEIHFLPLSNKLYIVTKKAFFDYKNSKIGFIGIVLPYPSESFFTDLLIMSDSEFYAALWSEDSLVAGNYNLFYSEKYKNSPPHQSERFFNLNSDTTLFCISKTTNLPLLASKVAAAFRMEILRDTTPLNKNIKFVQNYTIYTTLALFIIFTIVQLALIFNILKPVRKLINAADMVIKGKRLPELSTDRKDEFGELLNKIYEMAIKLYNSKLKAEEANKAKSEFLANMSHEIRTPLNSILGFTQIMDGFEELPPEHREYIKNIMNSGEHLLNLINQVLDIAKIESSAIELESKNFNLEFLIEEVCKIIRGKIKEEVDYIINLPDKSLLVSGDQLRIKQILINLLNNAIKFTQKGYINLGVEISMETSDFYKFLFYIKDTGKGINKDNLNKIFQSFTQEDSSISREYGGTGLGLTITKKLIEKMGGEIWVESEINKGTTFFFTLQLPKADMVTSEEIKPLDNYEILKDKKIIFIDDTPLNIKVGEKILSKYIKDIVVFDNPEKLKSLLNKEYLDNIDIVITDYRMPNLSGKDIAKTVKDIDKNKYVVCISSEMIPKQDKNQFDALLYKPILKNELLSALTQLFYQKSPETKSPPLEERKIDTNTKILIAEDNKMNQLMMRNLLTKIGYKNFKIVDNGQLALDEAIKDSFDFILMDINMPIMDGYTAAKMILAEKPESKIYALTANTLEGDTEKCIEIGMKGVIPKPFFKINDLIKILSS